MARRAIDQVVDSRRRAGRSIASYVLCTGIVTAVFLSCSGGCDDSHPAENPALRPAFDSTTVAREVAQFCGDCHPTPTAGSFPADQWAGHVSQGFAFYYESLREDLTPPPPHQIVEYFRREAPTEFEIPALGAAPSEPREFFTRSTVAFDSHPDLALSVADIHWLPLGSADSRSLVFSDIRHNELRILDPTNGATQGLAVHKPCLFARCDLDGDGVSDLVVAGIGTFQAADHQLGSIAWLPGQGTTFDEARQLTSGLARVSDVQPTDIDGDGDQDLVVAEFGWRSTGRVLLLRNRGVIDGELQFSTQVIDRRHGAIHVPVSDMDHDGRPDVVVLFGQEFETVEVLLNRGTSTARGRWRFDRRTIFEADHPAFGSTGIELVDLDGDGDDDVVYTNGDVLDTPTMRPYQGVQWLENRGTYPFSFHRLVRLPGTQRARAGDLDNDGDLDLAAVTMQPDPVIEKYGEGPFHSVVWLEQTTRGRFTVHEVEKGNSHHAALELGDFDADGDLDLAVGNFQIVRDGRTFPWIDIWWNQYTHGETPSHGKPNE